MMQPVLSVITPVYNRKELLGRCMRSLTDQTCHDFEWIVVDDGSMDGTREFMEGLDRSVLPFSLHYHWKENGGKHTALNAAHPFIRGKYVLLLDSDDTLAPDAAELVIRSWENFEKDPSIGGLVFLKKLADGRICCHARREYCPVDPLRQERIVDVISDCCEVIRTHLFLKYPFPVFEGEKFLAETALWYRAGLDCRFVCINKAVYICDYLDGGLTQSGKKLRMACSRGGMFVSKLRMNRRCRFTERLKAGILFVTYGKCRGWSAGRILKEAGEYTGLVFFSIIPGSIVYGNWKKKYGV